jgi:hypothetical protein
MYHSHGVMYMQTQKIQRIEQNLLNQLKQFFSIKVVGTLGNRCAHHRGEGRLGRNYADSSTLIEKCVMERA